MTAPVWLSAIVAEFGKGAGLSGFAFNGRDAAAMSFENGHVLRFEYSTGVLAVTMAVPSHLDQARAKALLAYANPRARFGFRVRAGYLRRVQAAVFAIRLEERDVTLPAVNQAFAVLWRIAQEFGGAP